MEDSDRVVVDKALVADDKGRVMAVEVVAVDDGSQRFLLSKTDVWKICKGALVAAAGAVLTYAATVIIPELEQSGDAIKLMIASVLMVAVNALTKFISDTRK